jgi:hypothetical protein
MRRGSGLVFAVYVILALYFINNAFSFIVLPEVFNTLNKWILLLGGIFLVLGGINTLRLKRFIGY